MSSSTDTSPWRLEWNDSLSVFIPEIDAEHRHFIGLVNDLNMAIAARMDMAEVKRRMQAIQDDAVAHFSHEEKFFSECGYPEAAEHAQKHEQIISALHEIMRRFEHQGTDYEWIEAGLEVKQILVTHLLVEDMQYRNYCNRNNLSDNGC